MPAGPAAGGKMVDRGWLQVVELGTAAEAGGEAPKVNPSADGMIGGEQKKQDNTTVKTINTY